MQEGKVRKGCTSVHTKKNMASRLSAFAALNNSDSESETEHQISSPTGLKETLNTNSESCRDSNPDIDFAESGGMKIDLGLNTGTRYALSGNGCAEIITTSNFSLLPGINVCYYNNHQILGLQTGDRLVMKGQYQIEVLHGFAEIDCYILYPGECITIRATNITSLPCVTTSNSQNLKATQPFSKPFSAIIKLTNVNDNLDSLSRFYPHLRNFYHTDNSVDESKYNKFRYTFTHMTKPESNNFGTSIPTSWKSAFSNITGDTMKNKGNQTILIIGNKNTGKSSFLKLLYNTLLSQSSLLKEDKIFRILDIDPGQPELCLPGCISLSELKSPLLGTLEPFKLAKTSEIVKFIGFNSPDVQPLNYFHQLNSLIEQIEKQSFGKNIVTFINSPGWVKGFGAEVISHIVSSIHISHLIQLSDQSRDLDILRETNWDKNTSIIKLTSINGSNMPSNPYSPSVIKNFKLITYMHYNRETNNYDFNPLILKPPFRIPYTPSNKRIDQLLDFKGVMGISIYDSLGLLPDDVPNALEAQYVSMITVAKSEIRAKLQALNNHSRFMSTSVPNIIDESVVQSLDSNFHGLAIIHSVDKKNKLFNIYTQADTTTISELVIQKDQVLIMVKGRQAVPLEEMYSISITKEEAQYWDSFGFRCLPYISPTLSNEGVGGKPVSIRRNIQRR